MPVSAGANVAPDFSTCPVCGKPCEPWHQRCWNDGEHLVHEACRDWSTAPFPFDWELDRLRRTSRALRRATKAVDAAGVWLAAVKRDWPRNALVRLQQWAEKRDALEAELQGLVERLRK